jgi:hypothetical protein
MSFDGLQSYIEICMCGRNVGAGINLGSRS